MAGGNGGADSAQRILDRCRWLLAEARRPGSVEGMREIDEELERLVAPERQRLLEQMVAAMQRIVPLLYGAGV